MGKFQKIFKKTVSLAVVLCFMVSIANLPAFAYETFENSGTTDAVLAQPFYTPAQLATQTTAENTVKETTSAKTKSTKKTSTAKPKATTKKASTKKAKVTTAKVKKIANQSISLINKLLKKKGTSKLAKTWLKKAKASINSMLKSKKSNATKYTWLNKALTSIKAISKAKASDLSLVQQTVKSGSVFSSFKNVLKKNATYKIYANYTAKIVSSINNLLKKTGISAVAKQWLSKAKTLVNNTMFGKKSNSAKKTWLKKAQTSINNVVKKNASNEVLRQESGKGKVFASLSNLIPTDNNNSESNPNDPVNPSDPVDPNSLNEVYSQEGVAVIKGLSTKTGLTQDKVFQIFSAAGVTKEQLSEVAATLSDKISKGETFVNTSAVALSKYLKIDEKLAAVQQLAVAIANGSDLKDNLSGNDNSVSLETQLAVAKLNGNNTADIYSYTLDDFMGTLKNGETAMVYNYYNTGLKRTIMVTKQNENSYVVSDSANFLNIGQTDGSYKKEPVRQTYTAEQFKQVMNNQKVSVPVSVPEANWSATWTLTHNAVNSDGKIRFISNSTGVKEKEERKLNEEYVQPAVALINNLLSEEGTSQLAKQWLNKAKEIVNGIINNNTNVSNEETQLKAVLASVERVAEQNASVAILVQETSQNSVLSSLQEDVLNKDDNVKNVIYPVFEQYAKPVVSTISNLLKNNNDLNESAQVWLNAAYNLIGNVMNEVVTATNEGKDCSQQKQWLQQALTSVENIKNENCSIEAIIQETSNGGTFSQLQETLENTTTYQAYQKYGEAGANIIRTFAKYINVLENVVFQQFVRYNVTSEKLQNAIPSLSNLMQKGANFFNCASLAVSKYLGISRVLALIQNVAADIAQGNGLGTDSMNTVATNISSEIKVLKTNGIENATELRFETLNNFMEALQVGEKAILTVSCYDLGGHAITIKREANGWGVFDTNRNKGEEVIYTPENFIKLMTGTNGTMVQGVKENGEVYSDKVYYTAITTQHKFIYENGGFVGQWLDGVYAITDSETAIALAA